MQIASRDRRILMAGDPLQECRSTPASAIHVRAVCRMTVSEWAPPNVLGFDIRDGASRSLPDDLRAGRRRAHQGQDLGRHARSRRFDGRRGPPIGAIANMGRLLDEDY
jgi:hypothetical protein